MWTGTLEFLLFEIAVQQVRGSHSLPRLLHTVWTQQDLRAAAASRVWHQGAQGHQGHLSDVWDQGVVEPDPVELLHFSPRICTPSARAA